ncbi:MAG: NAD(P)-dependent oxidoreductase [Lachnospiraceae bacterium]|nr:NAD(P)-dependent oxidoreductase [Lachnospiraceae bacterium]
MKNAVVTGGAGFAGYSLVKSLYLRGFRVICPVRPGSSHNERLEELKNNRGSEAGEIITFNLDMKDMRMLPNWLKTKGMDVSGCLFFHLAWTGGRDDFDAQYANVTACVDTVAAASRIGASKIIITGSQAEYGLKSGGIEAADGTLTPVTEDALPEPVNAYGAAKTAAMYLSRDLARHLGMEWNWVRIFSLYGECEHDSTMLSYLRRCLLKDVTPSLSSCEQTWDYLDVKDAAEALIAVAEKGKNGEIYNLASGDYKPLKDFTEDIRKRINPGMEIDYAETDPGKPLLSLRPSVEKIKRDTGWEAQIPFS